MSYLKLIGVIVVGITTMVGTAAADITGTYVGAQDGVNTFLSSDGTSNFSNASSAGVLWRDSTGGSLNYEIAGFTNSFAYEASDTDAEIVTTIAGLTSGNDYQIEVVYGDFIFAGDSLNAGFTSGSLNNFTVGQDVLPVDSASGILNVFEVTIGTDTAVGGEIDVFLGPDNSGDRYVYYGVAYTDLGPASVPEPSSLALLGLAGSLGLLRRRR